MAVTDDLAAFLKARLDEDEQAARAATPSQWEVARERNHWFVLVTDTEHVRGVAAGGDYDPNATYTNIEPLHRGDAEHIARHDPARVLRDVEAKELMVDEYEYWLAKVVAGEDYPALADRFEVARGMVRLLALPWEEHPNWREEWRP